MVLGEILIQLLGDCPRLVSQVGEMRWREWGHAPEPEGLEWWVDTTRREAGTDSLPVTWVATDQSGASVGAVGLAEFDIDERRDRSPWVIGMIVESSKRGQGIGGILMSELESWARKQGIDEIWVATERAESFYRKCGWLLHEVIDQKDGEAISVLRTTFRHQVGATGE